MGFIGSLLGLTPNSGANYQAQSANIATPITGDQVNAANAGTLSGIAGQQNALGLGQGQIANTQGFLNALAAQNGAANQSNVFGQQQGLAGLLGSELGANNYAGLQNQQQNTANQLQGIANGSGPNPALAELAQATGANNEQTAALMAGQRNSSANAGLMARQIAQTQAANNQNQVGQAATMQAQQSLGALGQLGAQQSAIGNTIGQGVNQNLAYTSALQNQQNALAGNANTMVGNMQAGLGANQTAINSQNAALGNVTAASQANQNALIGGLGNQNSAQVANVGSQNAANAGVQGKVAEGQSNMLSGLLSGAGSAAGVAAMSKGGEVDGPKSHVGRYFKSLKSGGQVAGRARVMGDSPRNDTVPAMLSPGEIVIPRHITEGRDAAKKAALFVAKALAAKRKK